MLKEFIRDNLLSKTGKFISFKCNESWFIKYGHSQKFSEINSTISFVEPFTLKLNCILEDIREYPICPVCQTNRVGIIQNRKFKRTCSARCANKDPARIEKIQGAIDYKKREEKRKETCLKRYGVENFVQTPEFKEKQQQTLFEKYGVSNISQVPEVKEKKRIAYKPRISINHPAKVGMDEKDVIEQSFIEGASVLEIAKQHKRAFSTIYKILAERGYQQEFKNSSHYEDHISLFIESLGIEYKRRDRKLISPNELDIYIPSHNLAIEFNGLYWHSELQGKDRYYHLNKTKKCNERDIDLIHIFENEWLQKREIVQSIICNRLQIFDKILYARECDIRPITSSEAKDFLEENHIQGDLPSSLRLGLVYNDRLESLMTFGKSRLNKNYEWELLRFCNRKGSSIVDASSKLFREFEKECCPESVITYSDLRYFTGSIYERLGFKLSHHSPPNYFYFKGNSMLLESRNKYQKHKLPLILETFDPIMTEADNMFSNGYNRIWDCGNRVFVKSYNQ